MTIIGIIHGTSTNSREVSESEQAISSTYRAVTLPAEEHYEIVKNAVVEAIRLAVTRVPSDVEAALKAARDREESDLARNVLDTILQNIKIGKQQSRPICQDTGLIGYYILLGRNFPLNFDLRRCLIEATREATQRIPLRPNAVHPFTNRNSGDNTGEHIPHIYLRLVDGDTLSILVVPKGGGSENMTRFAMLTPAKGIRGIKEFVLETIARAAGKPCPPNIVGVGVGGTADEAMLLAKTAVLLPVGYRNPDPQIAEIEEELLSLANQLGIGPGGLGGSTTLLDLHIKFAHRHPASLPVAVSYQCWAARQHGVIISSGYHVEYREHILL